MQNKQLTPLSYYSAPQASIYINGILLDECYDIQYSYRESKEPIYGYLDKFFNALVSGTVIITGSFTINYKHDQYLSQVLKKAANPTKYESNYFISDRATTGSKRARSLKEFDALYKQRLADYAESLIVKKNKTVTYTQVTKEIDTRLKAVDVKREEYKNNIINAETTIAHEQRAKSNFLDEFEPERQVEIVSGLEDYKSIIGIDLNTNKQLSPDKAGQDSYFGLVEIAYDNAKKNSDDLQITRSAVDTRFNELEDLHNKKALLQREYDKAIHSDAFRTEDIIKDINAIDSKINTFVLTDISDISGANNIVEPGLREQLTQLKMNLAEQRHDVVNDFAFDIGLANARKAEALDILSDADIARLKELDDAVILAEDELAAIVAANPDDPKILELQAKKEKLEDEIAQINSDAIRNDLIKINNDINALTVSDEDLQTNADTTTGWSRAEDSELPFTIEFNYNGTPHKRLIHCSLLGHGHQISMSGQPVKEYYQFISKKFEYQQG